jgi:hypothetical protein
LSFHDNQITLTKISLALSSGRDNHPPAATAEMAILIVAVFSSRLSRYTAIAQERLALAIRHRCCGLDGVRDQSDDRLQEVARRLRSTHR